MELPGLGPPAFQVLKPFEIFRSSDLPLKKLPAWLGLAGSRLRGGKCWTTAGFSKDFVSENENGQKENRSDWRG
jgi:hypothetical protein